MKEKVDTISPSERAELLHKLRAYYERIGPPQAGDTKSAMLIHIYKRWAILDLSKYIISHLEDNLPEDAVRDYMNEMAQYMKMCKAKPNMFACAFNIANSIWVEMVNGVF